MRREIVKAIHDAFLCDGWSFRQGFIYNTTGIKMELPALWLTPIELAGKTGLSEGVSTYKVILYLFAMNYKYTEEQKEEQWAELESRALDSCETLAQSDHVMRVFGLSCEPDEFAYTQFGELSMKVTFSVDMEYCR